MLLSNRLVRLAIDAAVMHGIDRRAIVSVLGPDADELLVEGGKLEWGSMVVVFDQLSRLVGGDRTKLAAIGRDMQRSPSRDVVRDVARGIVSPQALFRFVDRWITPSFPHMRLYFRFASDRRVQLRADIPEPYAASATFFYLLEARILTMTEMIGLSPCTLVESRITERSAELVLDLPRDRTLRDRARRTARALLARRESRAAIEEQRETLAESIDTLQRARDELRVLLDRIPDLVLVHRAGRIVWVNGAFVRALDYEELDQLVGTELEDHVTPAFKPIVRAGLARISDEPIGRGPPPVNEVCLVARDGSEVRVEVAPGQTVVFDGIPSRLLVARDVTERVRMQQRLIAMDRLASVGLLAAGVAHEVNNPLAYVLNNIELARKIAGIPEEAETSRAVLGVALEGVDRIRSIVRDLLLLSRGADVRGEGVDLRPVVESTLALAAREIEQHAQLEISFESAPEVDASGPRFAQVLLNLVSNALEAMRGRPRSESILRVHTRRAEDGRFLLEVSDNGRGISPNELRRIFEPFYTTKGAAEGTGLGLSIAQRLVVDMGGEITVESEEGKGTTFLVFLPSSGNGPSQNASSSSAPASG